MTYYKVLSKDGRPCNGGASSFRWPLPVRNADGTWTPGKWRHIKGDLVACEHGLHLCREQDLIQWLGLRIFEAEYKGDVLEDSNKIVVRKARLLSETCWDERIARLFACDCAEHVLPIFEKEQPEDKRPRQCIEVARRFANGEATQEELAAAWAAAGDAAWAAAWDTAGAAAGAAAWDAAWAAAWPAARAAAGDAAWAAAWDTAGAAAWAAARDAARDAEREWQTKLLMSYLVGELP